MLQVKVVCIMRQILGTRQKWYHFSYFRKITKEKKIWGIKAFWPLTKMTVTDSSPNRYQPAILSTEAGRKDVHQVVTCGSSAAGNISCGLVSTRENRLTKAKAIAYDSTNCICYSLRVELMLVNCTESPGGASPWSPTPSCKYTLLCLSQT